MVPEVPRAHRFHTSSCWFCVLLCLKLVVTSHGPKLTVNSGTLLSSLNSFLSSSALFVCEVQLARRKETFLTFLPHCRRYRTRSEKTDVISSYAAHCCHNRKLELDRCSVQVVQLDPRTSVSDNSSESCRCKVMSAGYMCMSYIFVAFFYHRSPSCPTSCSDSMTSLLPVWSK